MLPLKWRRVCRLSGFHYRRCWGLRPCVESGPEPEDSSPVLTWILGYFWSLPTGISPLLWWGLCTCAFLPNCSSSVTLPIPWIKGSVAFSPGFPMRLSHDAFPQGCSTCHCGGSRSSASKSRQCRENKFVRKPRRKATDNVIHVTGSVTLLLQLGRKALVHAPSRAED